VVGVAARPKLQLLLSHLWVPESRIQVFGAHRQPRVTQSAAAAWIAATGRHLRFAQTRADVTA